MAISTQRKAELQQQAADYNDKAENLQRETVAKYEQVKAQMLEEFLAKERSSR